MPADLSPFVAAVSHGVPPPRRGHRRLDAAPAPAYSIALRPGTSVTAVRERLLTASGNRLDLQTVQNPARRLGAVRFALCGLIVVLALIGPANLPSCRAAPDRR